MSSPALHLDRDPRRQYPSARSTAQNGPEDCMGGWEVSRLSVDVLGLNEILSSKLSIYSLLISGSFLHLPF